MIHPFDIHVGKKIRTLRYAQGASQNTLARALGITFQQVQKYESGKNRISASRMFETANFFDVDLNYFAEGYGENDTAPKTNGGAV